jgi:16S rRNA processing protein RimM
MLSEYILVGEVVKPFGILGAVKVKPYTDDPGRFQTLETVRLEDGQGYREAPMRFIRAHKGCVYLHLDGAACAEDAEKQRGFMLYVDRAQAVLPDEDAHFICDLIGCEAYDETGVRWGVLTDVLTHAPVHIYVIRTDKGVMMLPALKSAVPDVNVQSRRITLNAGRLREVAVFED